jgi:RNA polymerase sigma factor (sigma-70 family)
MRPTSCAPSSSELALLGDVLRRVARAKLSHQDTDDFVQSAQVRLLERRYDVFTQFAGRCSLRTYLTVVANRLLLDWRNSTRGKWRPSAIARHQGRHGVVLDRLINRDGLSAGEAIEMVRGGRAAPDAGALRGIADRLPRRIIVRHVPENTLEHYGQHSVDPIEAQEQRQRRHRAWSALASALRQLPREDQWLIRQRYIRRWSVREIADAIRGDERTLYRRFDRLRRSLRRALEQRGITESFVKTA